MLPLAGHLVAVDLPVNTFKDIPGVSTDSVAAYLAGKSQSLRGAIMAVNNSAAGNYTIVLPAGIYTLTLNGSDNTLPSAATGDLDVTKSVAIQGAGPGLTFIQAGTSGGTGIDKIFSVNPVDGSGVPLVAGGLSFSMTGVTLRYGRNTEAVISPGNNIGGAMDFSGGSAESGVRGSLTLTDVVFDTNATLNGDGGALGLFGGGTVQVTNCIFRNNVTGSTGAPATGGAIFISWDDRKNYVFTNCTIDANRTFGSAGNSGGGLFSFAGPANNGNAVRLTGCNITNNRASNEAGSHGGGLALADTTTIESCRITTNNGAMGAGLFIFSGATSLNRSSILGNAAIASAGAFGAGGACVADGASLTASFCRIVGNIGTASSPSQLAKFPTGILTTSNCWFGSNTPGGAQIGSGIGFNPFVMLTHNASANTVTTPAGTSTLTAGLKSNSLGNTLALPDLAAFTGLPVSFTSSSSGMISNTQPSLQGDGTATATFTGVSTGTAQTTAAVDGMSVAITITVNVPLTVLENWRLTFFNNSSNTGEFANTADFDKDGVPNLLEFAFGTDPRVRTSGPMALVYTGSLNGGGTLTLVGQPVMRFEGSLRRALFVRRKDFGTAGITYGAQFSPDLLTWTTTTNPVTVLASTDQNEICSLVFPSPAFDNAKQVFFRVKVDVP